MQRKFLKQVFVNRHDMVDDPLMLALRLARDARTHTSRQLNTLIEGGNIDDVHQSFRDRCAKVSDNVNGSSRLAWYKSINPSLSVHEIYRTPDVSELHRVSWTRLRLSAHSLAIEQGRWNRRGRGRLPIEERLCTCGQIQSERHVIEECPDTEQLRLRYQFTTVEELMSIECPNLPDICHKILQTYV